MLTDLQLVKLRIIEHEAMALELKASAAGLQGDNKMQVHYMREANAKNHWREDLAQELEQSGIDYFTITAEMARIRAEVRGEK